MYDKSKYTTINGEDEMRGKKNKEANQ